METSGYHIMPNSFEKYYNFGSVYGIGAALGISYGR